MKAKPNNPPDELNDAVRAHETGVEWRHRELATVCYRFFDVFNAEFFSGRLPNCYLQFDRARADNLGHYRPGQNVIGARHEINLNTRHLDRPLQDILTTLLHEMAHQWQDLYGKPGRGNYHNREFTDKCVALGIPCTGGTRSCTLEIRDPFIAVLRANGVNAAARTVAVAQTRQRAGTSKMKLWECGCMKIRAAVSVQARCLRCGALFERRD